MRQQRAIETREKIFQATLAVLAENGAAGVTHRAVAEQAGVSLASTTYHFKTKEDLLIKSYEWMVEQFEQSYRARLDDEQVRQLDRDGLTAYLLDVYRSERAIETKSMLAWYEFVVEALRQPQLQPTMQKWYRQTTDFYAALFEKAGVADPVAGATRYLEFLVGWELFVLCRGKKRSDLREYQKMVQRLLQGVFGTVAA